MSSMNLKAHRNGSKKIKFLLLKKILPPAQLHSTQCVCAKQSGQYHSSCAIQSVLCCWDSPLPTLPHFNGGGI